MSELRFLDNLQQFVPEYYEKNTATTVWHRLPVSRRSAVLVLLFLGSYGELRVILTKRSRKLRSFSGHVAFPGGKAEGGLESEWDTARREAEEEIGLPANDEVLSQNYGLKIEKVNCLPCYLARTVLAVRPCIGILKLANGDFNVTKNSLVLKLNPGESSSIFSVPLSEFCDGRSVKKLTKEARSKKSLPTVWAGIKWQYRSYEFPADNAYEAPWLQTVQDLSDISSNSSGSEPTRTVWGLTANMLYDVASIIFRGTAYWQAPRARIGDEDLLYMLWKGGQLQSGPRSSFEKGIIKGSRDVKFGDVLSASARRRLDDLYNDGARI